MARLSIEPLGDAAWLVRGADHRWVEFARSCPGVIEANVAYDVLGLYVDDLLFDPAGTLATLAAWSPEAAAQGRSVTVPVLFEGEDLSWVARAKGLTETAVTTLLTEGVFTVAAIGFRPGFPYLSGLPPPLCGLPRLPRPRVRVPAGSVSIVGDQAGIYPDEGPGGWRLVGRTPCRIVSVAEGWFPLAPGDTVRFRAIDADEAAAREGTDL